MSRLPVISYATGLGTDGKPKRQSGAYYLTTTTDLAQFYCFDEPREQRSEGYRSAAIPLKACRRHLFVTANYRMKKHSSARRQVRQHI